MGDEENLKGKKSIRKMSDEIVNAHCTQKKLIRVLGVIKIENL